MAHVVRTYRSHADPPDARSDPAIFSPIGPLLGALHTGGGEGSCIPARGCRWTRWVAPVAPMPTLARLRILPGQAAPLLAGAAILVRHHRRIDEPTAGTPRVSELAEVGLHGAVAKAPSHGAYLLELVRAVHLPQNGPAFLLRGPALPTEVAQPWRVEPLWSSHVSAARLSPRRPISLRNASMSPGSGTWVSKCSVSR